MPDAVNGQTDFGAGIYRGREAPENAVYDALNCLIDDEGQLYRRGGTTYRSANNAGGGLTVLTGLADAYTAAGRRTLAWGALATEVFTFDAANLPVAVPRYSTGSVIAADNPLRPAARATAAGGFLILPAIYEAGALAAGAFLYAGSLKPGAYTGVTVATTAGSRTVTGSGTSFLANVDAGMIFQIASGAAAGTVIPVVSVESNTSLTLAQPVAATAAGASGTFYPKVPAGVMTVPAGTQTYWAAAANRVLMTLGTRAYFSDPFNLFTNLGVSFPITSGYPDQYHELPSDAVIFGASSIRDTAILFTATGVWAISQLDFDPIDDMGNIQHRVEQINKDLILWGDPGISAYAGALVVPGLEDIVLLDATGGVQPISQAIRPLYRSYVKAGYQPGVAVVHRGHYFLPVLNGTAIVDVLVCRIDRGTAWTRYSGHAASTSYAQRVGEPSRAPLLLGVAGRRVTNLSDTFDPTSGTIADADGVKAPMTIRTRAYITPGRRRGSTTETLRLRYEATASGTPVLFGYWARYDDPEESGSLTSLIGLGASNGSDESVWRVGKRAPAIRFQLDSTTALNTFKLRSLEAPWRRST